MAPAKVSLAPLCNLRNNILYVVIVYGMYVRFFTQLANQHYEPSAMTRWVVCAYFYNFTDQRL